MSEEIDFNEISAADDEEKSISFDDLNKQNKFIKPLPVGEPLVLIVADYKANKNTSATNKKTNKTFVVGQKYKDGRIDRRDIHTQDGKIFTIPNWELRIKIEAALKKYCIDRNTKSFAGAKITITKLLDASHANTDIKLLASALKMSESEATAYVDKIKAAMKESKLYDVKVE